MNCTVCGAQMHERTTNLPFKTSDRTTLIVRGLPIVECDNCGEYLIEDPVMMRVDQIIATIGAEAELEIVRYAA